MDKQQEERLFNMVQDTHDTLIRVESKITAMEQLCPTHTRDIRDLMQYRDKMDGKMSVITVIVSAAVAITVACAVAIFRFIFGSK